MLPLLQALFISLRTIVHQTRTSSRIDFEDEDFDLDEDLKPAGDRGYVSLTPKAEEEATEPVEETTEKEEKRRSF